MLRSEVCYKAAKDIETNGLAKHAYEQNGKRCLVAAIRVAEGGHPYDGVRSQIVKFVSSFIGPDDDPDEYVAEQFNNRPDVKSKDVIALLNLAGDYSAAVGK